MWARHAGTGIDRHIGLVNQEACSLVSSNGQYSVRVTDDGGTVHGPGGTIRIGPTNVEVSAVDFDLLPDA